MLKCLNFVKHNPYLSSHRFRGPYAMNPYVLHTVNGLFAVKRPLCSTFRLLR